MEDYLDNPINQSQQSRIHIFITGRVQNVGFRSFVQKVAASLSLSGWVRNVKYDQVEVMAEGFYPSLDEFINLLKVGSRGSRVDDIKISWVNFTGEFIGFNIRTSQ
jgi:acylphosphatase